MAASLANDVPDMLLRRIVELWRPEEIWLFGSRARGDFHEQSDWDLLVIVANETPLERLDAIWTRRKIRDLHIRADVIPVSRSDFEEGRRWIGSLAELVVAEGVQVYRG